MSAAADRTPSWTDERLDDLATSMRDGFAHVDRRFERVDHQFEQIDRRFERVDQRFVQMDQRFIQVDQRFVHMDERFDRLEDRISSLQRVLVAGMFGFTGTLIATMLAIVLRLG